MMIIEAKYSFGQTVYLKTDIEQYKRMITRIQVSPTGLQYCLTCGDKDSWHYEIEISLEKDIMIKVEN